MNKRRGQLQRARARERNIAAHPVFAAMNRRGLTDAELQQIEAFELLALVNITTGRMTAGECADLFNLVGIGVFLARAGVGPELLQDAEALLTDMQPALCLPEPAAALVPVLGRLTALREHLAAQRRLALRAEWIRTMQRVCGQRRMLAKP